MKKLSIGFSPCPNDTFIFDALVHNKIDCEGLSFDVNIADVEELNKRAQSGEIDITKLSFHAYAHLSDKYILLNSGSALGDNNGPILVSKLKIYPYEINDLLIAIPGKNTTANLLLSIAYPKATDKREMLFSDIEEAVLSERVDAGLIIHESRFTYKAKGLKKIIDLGKYWQEKTGLPIPLGGIAIKRDLPLSTLQRVDRVLHRSVEYAFQNQKESLNFIKKHAQTMSDEVIFKHIKLYVNKFTKDLGEDGKQAISTLYDKAEKTGLIPLLPSDIFVDKI